MARDVTGPDPDREQARAQLTRVLRVIGGVVAVLVVGTVVVSLAGAGWGWTGLPAHPHLWDWLQILVLPFVLLVLPLWLRTRERLPRTWAAAFGGFAALFAVLVVGGYLGGWEWTGFSDNTLWDWLELLVLPFSVALLPVWLTAQRRFSSRHVALAVLGGIAFVVLVVCGYVIPWAWTGFSDNTLLDWVHLFLVPFLIPAAVTVLDVRETAGVSPPGS